MFIVSQIITYAAALSIWMSPMPQFSTGWMVNYGSEFVLERNADYRGYDHAPYKCLGSLMSPSQLGEIFWLRSPKHTVWLGPCLSVDAGQRIHFLDLVYRKHEIVEVGEVTAKQLGFEYGIIGEIWIGDCPPLELDYEPGYYNTDYSWRVIDWADPEGTKYTYLNAFWPYPAQHFPKECELKNVIQTDTHTKMVYDARTNYPIDAVIGGEEKYEPVIGRQISMAKDKNK